MADYQTALNDIVRDRREALRTSLKRRFPSTSDSIVDECFQDTLLEASDPKRWAWFQEGLDADGVPELERRIYVSAWRRIRGELRKVGHKRTGRLVTGFDAVDGAMPSPSDGAEAGQLEDWMASRVEEAAGRFGRARAETLQQALESLVRSGHKVKPLAVRYGLPRRYVAEASLWLRRRLESRARDE